MIIKRLFSFAIKYLGSTQGATAIEYGLLVAGVALAIAGAVFLFGDAIYNLLYDDLPTALDG